MELKNTPAWQPPQPRKAPTHTACAEDWFARHDSQPDQRPEDDALIADLVVRAFGS